MGGGGKGGEEGEGGGGATWAAGEHGTPQPAHPPSRTTPARTRTPQPRTPPRRVRRPPPRRGAQVALKQFGIYEDSKDLLAIADTNGDGQIDYSEFSYMLRSNNNGLQASRGMKKTLSRY